MWSIRQIVDLTAGRYKIISSILLVTILFAALSIYTGTESGYTPVTTKCISCHNDTTYPEDTDSNGYVAPYKHPHNNTVMCESCHRMDLHDMKYIQPDGTYGAKTTSAKCPDCHQAFINNSNFSSAPHIPDVLKHSSNLINGSIRGNYWTSPAQACIYCHGDTKHNVNGLGKIRLALQDTNNTRNGTLTYTTWCADCHYNDSNQNYIGTLNIAGGPTYVLITGGVSYTFTPVPPLITVDNTNKTGWVNHSGYLNAGYKDHICKACHALNGTYISSSLNYSHSLDTGNAGGPDCIVCHDKSGFGAPPDKRVDAASIKMGLHRDLNSNAKTTRQIDYINKACWACHGNGSEPSVHPQRYKNPQNCQSDECHSLVQSRFNEPMIYSHFRNSSRNGNPKNLTNYNITTSEECSSCHINSVFITDNNTALSLVSHYGSRDKLVDSFNCRYCHLDKDKSEDWGNATLINKERTSLIPFDKERNKLRISDEEKLYLGEGYFLELREVSKTRNSALIHLTREEKIIDETLVSVGIPYQYEKEITIDNSTFKTPIIIINITSIFESELRSFIQFEGYRIRKIHTEREGIDNSACFACHLYRYSNEKQRYQVIDREYDENPSNNTIYFIQVFVDFKSENKSKIYFNDENEVFNQLNSGKSISYSSPQKFLEEGELWNIAKNYYLRLDGVSSNGQEAILTLKINEIVEQQLIKTNTEFNFTPGLRYKESGDINITIFKANVSAIGKGSTNFVILKDVIAKSPVVMKSTADTRILGYNASWFRQDDLFMAGKIPENLHSPNLFTDQMGWTDCVKCHDESKNLRISSINAISSRLGKHSKLNENATNRYIVSDPIDKACWACHTQGKEIQSHSPTFISPRNCRSCHVYQEEPFYGAINISDEHHELETNCEICHLIDSHILTRYQVTPVIVKAILSKTTVSRGETIELTAKANAGYGMRIRAAEYFIDTKGTPGTGKLISPLDGTFDSQKEEMIANIDTKGLSNGEHEVYVHAMERNNRWGEYYILTFEVIGDFGIPDRPNQTSEIMMFFIPDLNTTDWSIIFVITSSISVYIFIKYHRVW